MNVNLENYINAMDAANENAEKIYRVLIAADSLDNVSLQALEIQGTPKTARIFRTYNRALKRARQAAEATEELSQDLSEMQTLLDGLSYTERESLLLTASKF